MGGSDAGATPYFFIRHSAVVCVVDSGWLVQEPAGCLAVGFLALSAVLLDLPSFDEEGEEFEP